MSNSLHALRDAALYLASAVLAIQVGAVLFCLWLDRLDARDWPSSAPSSTRRRSWGSWRPS